MILYTFDLSCFTNDDFIRTSKLISCNKTFVIKNPKNKESVAGVMLLANGLRECYGTDFVNTKFKYKNGKPYIDDKNIFFSLSHSCGTVACGFDECDIGIDIEGIRNVDLRVAKKYFSSSENKYIDMFDKDKNIRFLQLWTLKEAYAKMTSEGISKSLLKSIVFSLENGEVVTEVSGKFSTTLVAGYVISTCKEANILVE